MGKTTRIIMTSFNHLDYTTTHQDQKLDELVAPALRQEVRDLIDEILTTFAGQFKDELREEGWGPPKAAD